MNKTFWISLAALTLIVIAIPVYGLMEPRRMDKTNKLLRETYVMDGIELYIQNCAACHGATGEGIGLMPALNIPGLANAQTSLLFKTIAGTKHGSAMAAWHINEGGILNDYQVKEMVTLIQEVDWKVVERISAVRGFVEPPPAAVETGMAYLETEGVSDPHQCINCHEEPPVHADLFGINCARCHNTMAWTPAALTRHDFLLGHGGNGEVTCATCHPDSYMQYDCYSCHLDHQPEEMDTVHISENISEYTECALCHPTGESGEAGRLRDTQMGIFASPTLTVDEALSIINDPNVAVQNSLTPKINK